MKKKWIFVAILACMLTAGAACDNGDVGGLDSSQVSIGGSSWEASSSDDANSEDISSSEDSVNSGENSNVDDNSGNSGDNVNSGNSGDNSSSSDSNSGDNSSSSDSNSGDDSSSSGGSGSSEEKVVYYTVTFDTDGGSAVASVKVEKGGKVSKPEDPKKSSSDGEYEFLGWYNGDVKWNFDSDTVTQDITITAKWKKSTSYTPPFLPKD